MSKIKPNYTRAVVILHGKSEYQIFKFVKSNLRLKIEEFLNNKSSIQINDLKNTMNNEIFGSKKKFIRKYDDIEYDSKAKELINFKIFIIMDTDDCTEEQKQKFIDGTMFNKHWAKDYIVPIYNIANLEDVMKKIGVKIEKKKDYIKVFPTDKKYTQQNNDIIQINNVSNLCKRCEYTNLEVFLQYCLECTSTH